MSEALALCLELEGTQLIEASAGTGKTWTLSVLLVRALVERELRTSQVLAITFTRAATAEIKGRVLALLQALDAALAVNAEASKDAAVLGLLARFESQGLAFATARARTRRALAEFDDLSVFTIHGFYQRTLRENALSTGDMFEAGVETQIQPELEAAALEFWRRELAHYHTLSGVCAEPSAKTLATLLLGYKLTGEKQPVFQSPPAMAAWVKRLLQRAPQAQSSEIQAYAAAFSSSASACAQHLSAYTQACEALRLSLSEQHVANALIDLRARKCLLPRVYAQNHVANWLALIAHWLASEDRAITDPPEKLSLNFTSDAIRSILKDAHTPLPTSLRVFTEAVDAWCIAYIDWRSSLHQLHALMRAWLFAHCARELPLRLAARGVRSAESLAAALVDALHGPRGDTLAQALRTRYALVLVDEFQDTDSAQWAVMQRVFVEGNTPLLLVGDPKQAIYRFRGADIAAYLRARAQARAVHQLRDNFRSTPRLIGALNALFTGEGAGGGYGDAQIAYTTINAARDDAPAHNGLFVQHFEQPPNMDALRDAAARGAVEAVRALLQHTPPNEIALLVERNEDVSLMSQALSRAGIATAARRQQSIAESFEALQVQWLIEALARPLDEARLRRLMLTPLWGAQPQALSDEQGVASAREQVIAWAALARARGPGAAFEAVLRARGTAQRWLQADAASEESLAQNEESLARLRQVAEIVQRYCLNVPLDESLRFLQSWRHGGEGPRAYAPHISDALNATDALPSDDRLAMPRIASERPAVQVMTVHTSKGLEFGAVVLPLLWAGKDVSETRELLVERADGTKRWNFGPVFDAAALAQHAADEAGERQRVAYVALTRARDVCVVLWPESDEANDADSESKSSKATVRAERSALGALLGVRSWASMDALVGAYSPDNFDIADVKSGKSSDTNDSINKNTNSPSWPRVPAAWQMMSFSRWQRGLVAAVTDELEEATMPVADRDDVSLDKPITTGNALTDELCYSFPRGAAAGRALHAMLERLPFSAASLKSSAAEFIVTQSLAQHGMPAAIKPAATLAWLSDVMTAAIAMKDAPLRLCDVDASLQQREWEFHLPLAGADVMTLRAALVNIGVQSLQAITDAAPLPPGFFTGFVDLVFEHEGRYYLVDYKSNYLGDRDADYAPASLTSAVQSHHYDAQAALYLVALHRHLRAVLPGYMPEQHLGGAMLLFLRGMNAGSASGVWSLPWSVEALLKLDAVIAP
jgi:exodeoxyribonuclease V beta subunit